MDGYKEGINHQYQQNKIQGDIDVYWSKSNNRNAKTILHTHGSSAGEEWVKSKEAALNKDDTFIFAKDTSPRGMNEVFEDVCREVFEQKEDTSNLILTGHSAGAETTLKNLVTMYKEGKITGDPPLVVMLDGSFSTYGLTDEEIKILADKKVPIIAYYAIDSKRGSYEKLGQNGVNIAIIKEYDLVKDNHGAMSVNFFDNKNGLYDFICNNGELEPGSNGYGISVWSDGEPKYTNGSDLKDMSEANTLIKIYSMMGINTFKIKINHLQNLNYNKNKTYNLATNNNIFNLKIEEIISKIGNTSFISSNINYSTINNSSSTTSKIADLSNEYFINTTDLLYNVSIELEEFKKTSHVLSSVETQIGQSAVQLNNTNLTTPLDFSKHKDPFILSQQR